MHYSKIIDCFLSTHYALKNFTDFNVYRNFVSGCGAVSCSVLPVLIPILCRRGLINYFFADIER